MSSFAIIILASLIIFGGGVVQATFGFGFALIVMPLLTMLIGIEVATPVVALLGSTMAVLIVAGSRHDIDWTAARHLIIAAFFGVPLGVLILRYAPLNIVETILALFLIFFGTYNLFSPRLPQVHGHGITYVMGFLSGLLAGAYNIMGPPVIVYGALKRWPPREFRATIQGYLLIAGLAVLVAHAVSGMWTVEVGRLFVVTLVTIPFAVWLGSWLNRNIDPTRFNKLVYVGMIILGLLLMLS